MGLKTRKRKGAYLAPLTSIFTLMTVHQSGILCTPETPVMPSHWSDRPSRQPHNQLCRKFGFCGAISLDLPKTPAV